MGRILAEEWILVEERQFEKKKKSVLCEDTAVPPFPQDSGEPGQPGEPDHGLTATGEVQKSRGNQQLALGISFQLLDLPWKH